MISCYEDVWNKGKFSVHFLVKSEHKDLIGPDKKYNVDGFPTIILVKNDGQDQIKFNAIEYNDMLEKIKSNLQ